MSGSDRFLGCNLDGYVVQRRCGVGNVGAVYYARKEGEVVDERAIKFIPHSILRATWQQEINKVTRLANTPGVVPYVAHDDVDVAGVRYRWIAWRYIDGSSLRSLIREKRVSIPILCDVVRRTLSVLHACDYVQIEHGDLHAGNILVEAPNPMNIDPEEQRIWITDFGYLSASMGKEMLDDFHGLSVVISDCLRAIDYHSLDGNDKRIYSELKHNFVRDLAETNPVEGEFVRQPRELLRRFDALAAGGEVKTEDQLMRIGDYLAAETLGDRYDEWKALFVPSFLGSDQLLGRNVCVLTDLRGCGKTMVFRRLTALYDFRLGPSGVRGAESFLGFYVNARTIAEAFPWLPTEKEGDARGQVMHFFHVCWILDILEWLGCLYRDTKSSLGWLVAFFQRFYGDRLVVTDSREFTVRHLRSFFTSELERSRLRSGYHQGGWELDRIDFLELLAATIGEHVRPAETQPFYLFLDDYSTPLVPESTQRILNAIVFRRSARVIFKVATESVESIELQGLHDKVLEQEDDFLLVDTGTETLQRSKGANRETITNILQPRIDRDPRFAGRNLTVEVILGRTPYRNTDLARHLRADRKEKKARVLYHGAHVFCDLWSSNTREMITLFADLVGAIPARALPDDSRSAVAKSLVSPEEQDRLFRGAGSRFRDLLVSATDPTRRLYQIAHGDRSYGEHLQKIADAFHEMADHDLQTKHSKNGPNFPPKQARRIEIADVSHDLPDEVVPIYRGMIRYGVFIRDWRGKSARGKAVPRLVMRGILIPYYTLTFSRRDSITLEWDEFCAFLREPKDFAAKWIKTQPESQAGVDQPHLPGMPM
jgi:tRNA A-37 threonylcarbamoyl transferase component Bud32